MTVGQGAGTKIHLDLLEPEFLFYSVSVPCPTRPICLRYSQPEHQKSCIPGTSAGQMGTIDQSCVKGGPGRWEGQPSKAGKWDEPCGWQTGLPWRVATLLGWGSEDERGIPGAVTATHRTGAAGPAVTSW